MESPKSRLLCCGSADESTILPVSQLLTASRSFQNGLKHAALTTLATPTSSKG
jgi:hypothetical protein